MQSTTTGRDAPGTPVSIPESCVVHLSWALDVDEDGPQHGPGGGIHDLGSWDVDDIDSPLLDLLESRMLMNTCLAYRVCGQDGQGEPIRPHELRTIARFNDRRRNRECV